MFFNKKFETFFKLKKILDNTIIALYKYDFFSVIFIRMGAADSTFFSTAIDSWRNPDLVPKVTDKPRHDPNYGFQEQRTERGFLFIFDDFFLIISFK